MLTTHVGSLPRSSRLLAIMRDRAEGRQFDPQTLATMLREALNHALRNIPADKVRMHVCWGNYEGPHTLDIPLSKIANAIVAAKPKYLLLEGANPRHAHEWAVWKDVSLPADKVLVPGVIDSTSNFVAPRAPDFARDTSLTTFGRGFFRLS